jgi:hypothetical protein
MPQEGRLDRYDSYGSGPLVYAANSMMPRVP